MPTANIAATASSKSKRRGGIARHADGKKTKPSRKSTWAKPSRKSASAVVTPQPAKIQLEERATKQERMLTLLSKPEGASIAEMMQATNWRQHSVRGFLAGTVKKKLGFVLSSSKAEGDVRRYRIEKRRGR